MKPYPVRVLIALSICVLACALPAAAGQAQAASETARRQFDSGRAFLRDGRHAEALKDFQSVVQLFPSSDVADDAQLAIAELQLSGLGEPAAARATLEQLLTKYPSGTAAPMAFVLLGRVQLSEADSAAAVDGALASFDRVRRLFPDSDAVPAASYYAGEALRRSRRFPEALLRYQRVLAEHPRSEWAPRARLGSAQCLVVQGKPLDALSELQRIRTRFPETPEAARAIAWSTILYRLYVRPPAQPPYSFAGRTVGGRVSDVRALAIDKADQLYVVLENAIRIFGPAGTPVKDMGARDARAICFDPQGGPVVFNRGTIQKPGSIVPPVFVRRGDGTSHALDSVETAVATSTGQFLVADRDSSSVYKLDGEFKVIGAFSTGRPAKLALTSQDDLAMLDEDAKSILVTGRDSAPVVRVPSKGTGYTFDNPVDLAIDPLGHMVVLDRGRANVVVFDPNGKYLLTFGLAETAPGAFRRAAALAIDSAGRLYIADDKASGVLVFQ
jgi:TolA-binding protein